MSRRLRKGLEALEKDAEKHLREKNAPWNEKKIHGMMVFRKNMYTFRLS